ncbi:MAG: UDP-glucose 4-epimerase GalE [Bryobacterales bacterium]
MILVTGGAGYIGSIAAERLLERGFEVCVYDSLFRGYRDAVPDRAAFVEGDLADREKLRRVFREHSIDAVMHFAALAEVSESMRDASGYFRNNVGAALVLIEEAHAAGVKRFVFSSTCALFGDQAPSPIAESAPANPISPYGESKWLVERMLAWYRQVHGLTYFCLRYFNACGATATRGERHDPETHLIPLVLQAAAGERDAIKVYGSDYPTPDGTCVRDYIHVLDLADAHIATLDAPDELSGCYNAGTGRGNSVREVIDTVRRVTGREVREVAADRRPGDAPELVADPALIRAKLGWQAKYSLEDAVRSAWEFRTKVQPSLSQTRR